MPQPRAGVVSRGIAFAYKRGFACLKGRLGLQHINEIFLVVPVYEPADLPKAPLLPHDHRLELRASELAMLLDGIDLRSVRRVKRYARRGNP